MSNFSFYKIVSFFSFFQISKDAYGSLPLTCRCCSMRLLRCTSMCLALSQVSLHKVVCPRLSDSNLLNRETQADSLCNWKSFFLHVFFCIFKMKPKNECLKGRRFNRPLLLLLNLVLKNCLVTQKVVLQLSGYGLFDEL